MLNPYVNRKYLIGSVFSLFILAYLVRLFYIQVIDDQYKFSAENNSQRRVIKYPPRGVIYDRNGILMVQNEAAFDLMVIPRQVQAFDTSDFCQMLNVSLEDFSKMLQKAADYSGYRPSALVSQVSAETYAVMQEKMFKFPGFFFQSRTLRRYPRPVAAHLLGYVGEVDERVIKDNPYYLLGDYIGISGVEAAYEEYLRGKKGVSIYTVDVHNRIVGHFAEGTLDTVPVLGNDIVLSIDIELQEYAEKLMQNKRGCVVAIDPSTGQILALVNSPTYDPNLLVGRVRAKNYHKLLYTEGKPLFNRATMAKYPPGSTFKMANGLIALQEGVISDNTTFGCSMGFRLGNVKVGCHAHASPLDLVHAVSNSCNAYFCHVFRKIIDNPKYKNTRKGFEVWRSYMLDFGFGRKLESDQPHEGTGNIPTPEYYDKYFGANRWRSLTIISLSIGQGEIGVTPFQLANFGAVIGNRGWYYLPHMIREIKGLEKIPAQFTEKHVTKIQPEYYEFMVEGMEQAVLAGTARIARLDSVVVCGKTGTAQNPHGKDHSVFLAFAPKDNPVISIAVIVENGGFGATYAAPIASLCMEKYLFRTVKRTDLEERMTNAVLLNVEKTIKPKNVAQN
jgi:penicillin-binding protein 2